MNLFIVYFVIFFVGLSGWILYYKTRETEEQEQDVIALGVVLASSFVVVSTLVLNLGICSFLYG